LIGAWEDLWVDLNSDLHPPLHPRAARSSGRVLTLARLIGLGVVDFEVALNRSHGHPDALLIALAALASAATLVWLSERPRGASSRPAALSLMALAGGLLGALQHGSTALAFPGLAVAQALADGSALEASAICALALVALEAGVIWSGLGASAALGYPAILLGAAMIGLTRRQYVAQSLAAEALLAQTQRTQAESRRAAALDERTRIAREIHDVLAHALGGLTVQLEAAELLLDERHDVDGALERIRACRRTAREGLDEARRAVAALRSDSQPLPRSLAGLLESHRDQGADGELAIEGDVRVLSPEVELALMRAVQEALTNARRHAPGSIVRVRLVYEATSTRVTITNDTATRVPSALGAGRSGGYGLAGMRERLELAGGSLAAGASGEGWTVSAEVPC
jgi:signal transduction histidine kinase